MCKQSYSIGTLILVFMVALASCGREQPKSGTLLDEARRANRGVDSFPAADEEYFRDMDQNKDGVVALTANEAKGRNAWIVWTGAPPIKKSSRKRTTPLETTVGTTWVWSTSRVS